MTGNLGLRITRNKTGFRGVYKDSPGRFRAEIGHRSSKLRIGWFSTAESAAKAYDEAARKRYAGMAFLNFPENGENQVLPPPRDFKEGTCVKGHLLTEFGYIPPNLPNQFRCRACNLEAALKYKRKKTGV